MSYASSPHIKRIIKAVRDSVDEPLGLVEIAPDGTVRVLTASQAAEQRLTPLEAWRAKRGGRAA